MSEPAHRHDQDPPAGDRYGTGGEAHGGHSMWLMLVCCIPMVIPILLILFGR